MVIEAHKPKALQVRIYGEKIGDYQTVSSWWEARHGAPLTETILPPLGVIVEDEKGPCAALWCYQSVGIGVCFLEFPISRPGLGVSASVRAFEMCVEACVRIAKAQGDYSLFRCYTLPSIARILKRFGFWGGDVKWLQMTIRRD
jgi:hypothetical protein